MLTTGIAVSLGGEQAGVLLGAAGAGDVTSLSSMSFAKCFGEVAGGAGGVKGTMPAGQLLPNLPGEAATSVAKNISEITVGAAALPVKMHAGQVLRDDKAIETSSLTAPSVATSSDVAAVVPAETHETTTKVPVKAVVDGPSAGDGKTVAIASQPAVDLKDVCDDLPVSVGQVEGGAEDKAPVQEASQETGEAKVAPMPYAGASVVAQSMPHEAVRPGSQKETGATEKAQTTTPVKKEAKSKAGAGASEVEAKVGSVSALVVETPVATVVPANGVAPIVAQTNQSSGAAESDSRVAPARSGLGSGIGKAVAGVSGHAGRERTQVGKRVSGVFEASKDVGTAVSTAGEGVVGHTGKDGSNSTKVPAAATSADEVRAQGAGGAAVAPMVHSATGIPGHVIGDASPAKPHIGTVSSPVARVQEESRTVATAAPASEWHRTLIATPTTLEVGIANGTHGWLKVRAEMTGGGQVNASLSAASSAGQEMLHRELSSLTAYLQEERVGVNAVVLHASTGDSGSQQFSGAMDGNGGRGQMQQSAGQGGDGGNNTEAAVLSDRSEDAFYSEGLSGVSANGWLAPAIYAGGVAGGWLSVRA
jgi:hypothetical protein